MTTNTPETKRRRGDLIFDEAARLQKENDDLHATIAAQEEQIAGLTDRLTDRAIEFCVREDERVTRLMKYAKHEFDCDLIAPCCKYGAHAPHNSCTCGLAELEAQIEKG